MFLGGATPGGGNIMLVGGAIPGGGIIIFLGGTPGSGGSVIVLGDEDMEADVVVGIMLEEGSIIFCGVLEREGEIVGNNPGERDGADEGAKSNLTLFKSKTGAIFLSNFSLS